MLNMRPIRGTEKALPKLKLQLATLLKKEPNALLKAVKAPEISTPFNVSNCPEIRLTTALVQLIYDLSIESKWPLCFDALRLNNQNRIILFDRPAQGVELTSQGLMIKCNGSWNSLDLALKNGWATELAMHKLGNTVELALWDANPLFQVEAHPEKEGNAIDLGGRSTEEWLTALTQALTIIKEAIPEWWNEFPQALHRIVPVGYHAERHNSASYAEALGLAYVSLHPNALTMAEAIVHETQHNKLNTLLQMEPVLRNGHSCWTTSPVRPDLRPLNGVLLAAHAFVPVSAMHHRLMLANAPQSQHLEFNKRRIEVLQSNQKAIDTLKEKAEPTKRGATILNGLYALDAAIRAAS